MDRLYHKAVLVEHKEGDSQLISTKVKQDISTGDKYHTFLENQTLEEVAGKYYGDSKLWYKISMGNDIFNPFDIEVGTVLRIPKLRDEA